MIHVKESAQWLLEHGHMFLNLSLTGLGSPYNNRLTKPPTLMRGTVQHGDRTKSLAHGASVLPTLSASTNAMTH